MPYPDTKYLTGYRHGTKEEGYGLVPMSGYKFEQDRLKELEMEENEIKTGYRLPDTGEEGENFFHLRDDKLYVFKKNEWISTWCEVGKEPYGASKARSAMHENAVHANHIEGKLSANPITSKDIMKGVIPDSVSVSINEAQHDITNINITNLWVNGVKEETASETVSAEILKVVREIVKDEIRQQRKNRLL